MRKIALLAAVAAAVSGPALAEAVYSTVASVDAKRNVIILGDRTVMTVAKDVDISKLMPGSKVIISAKLDEDGYAPATAVTAAQ